MKEQKEKLNKDDENYTPDEPAGFSGPVKVAALVMVLIGMIVWSPMLALILEARFNEVKPSQYEHIVLSVIMFLIEALIFAIVIGIPIWIKRKIKKRKN